MNTHVVRCYWDAHAVEMAGLTKAIDMRIASSLRMVRLPWSKHVFRYLHLQQMKLHQCMI